VLAVLVSAAILHAGSGTLGYDPESDPAADLRAAVEDARARGSRILVIVGGEWCSWCHILDRFVKGNEEIHILWERHFVTLKVHYDPETTNEDFLGRYPEIEGYPHIFVLDEDGALLHSQNTELLEEGGSYSTGRMRAFLTRWAPDTTPSK
jgi:thioredoxin-related protein